MSPKLPRDLQDYVKSKVASGEFDSLDEVLVHAVRIMRRVEDAIPSANDDLRREIDLGIQSLEAGQVAEWDVDEMKERIRKAAAKRKKAI